MTQMISANSVDNNIFDVIVIVSDSVQSLSILDDKFSEIRLAVEQFSNVCCSLNCGGDWLIHAEQIPSKRIIYSSTGPINNDFDDVRKYLKAGISAGNRFLSTGARSPLLITLPTDRFPNAQLTSSIGFLHSLYTPLLLREKNKNFIEKADLIGILEIKKEYFNKTEKLLPVGSLVDFLQAIQSSFDLCRDIGDGDPQRMSPFGVAEYILETFKDSTIKVNIIENKDQIMKEYPLMAAVSRCSDNIEEYRARMIWLEYIGEGELTETLFIVGKGVTIDTGGANLKIGGSMYGMSRDKYGSAVLAVWGFFRALDILKPSGIKVIGCMCMCRNSIGSNSYTTDEILTGRSGKTIHITNTDAEGRLAIADALAQMKELALNSPNPHLLTIATLTGHVCLAYGHCTAAMDNGPARAINYAEQLRQTGDLFGQPVEVSRLYSEDFSFHCSDIQTADLKQSDIGPSVQTRRGHQGPAAFLIGASGLSECGLNSCHPIKYTHLDIGLVMGAYPGCSLPSPLLTLIAHHILNKTKFPKE
ncbi:CYTOSOL_AP domain-containing protein [Meloidogyne graminicola]|uniref:CYTOSOL_AP domain-containing protein n=1 Tax=Meloidogyne graminicola TaxID=189291 RepID=A0A8S9ZZP7_9BILA|nr:CYTOSOL_AP domain-containing protein [Meloidogyne graminicola]